MTKQELVEYSNLQKEIQGLERRIERSESKPSVVTEMVQNGWKRTTKVTRSGYNKR